MAWSKTTRISIMLAIDILFFLVELISGLMVHSLALTADAFHMLNDIISLIIGLWAVTIATRATTNRFSYGWEGMDTITGTGTGMNMMTMATNMRTITMNYLRRRKEDLILHMPMQTTALSAISYLKEFSHERNLPTPRRVAPNNLMDPIRETDESSVEDDVTVEAVIRDEYTVDENSPLVTKANSKDHGTMSNKDRHIHESPYRSRRDSGVHDDHHHAKPKSKSKKGHGHNHADMGMNAMVLHVLGDALGNVGVIATALIIWLTDWPGRYYADPAVSLFITLIILKSAIPLTKATSKVLLQATPDHLDLEDVREDIQRLPGVISCHHVHIWQLSDTKVVASLHVQIAFPITDEGGAKYMKLAKQARKCLHAYGIHSATIQPEFCLVQDCNHLEEGSVSMDGQQSPLLPGLLQPTYIPVSSWIEPTI
ncbi:hypothetical protein ONZ43_g5035 [Nemania bipapillata]|uniref:Uncharacterized protein n=1 Tax=Nemania bipapillata TaxID=110536 RepID=A0ACC2IFG0_9PEZI|nr:hypothetical protein ONZ43_g5035 [Nemania bipapillata]